jgi:hypothetical protein
MGLIQTILVLSLLAILSAFIIGGLIATPNIPPSTTEPPPFINLLRATAFVFVVYLGGEAIAGAQEEIKQPARTQGWYGGHQWAFTIDGEQYGENPWGDSDMDMLSSRSIKLSQLVEEGLKKFRYTYDFGDSWEHVVTVEKTLEAHPTAKYPHCTAGKRACPPEDCGGPWGYDEFLVAISDPKHKEHDDLLEWVGGEFDPEKFDLSEVNQRLAAIR